MPRNSETTSLADATAAQNKLAIELSNKTWLHGVGITIDPSNAKSYAVLLRVDAGLKRNPPPELANYEEFDGVRVVVDWRHSTKRPTSTVSEPKVQKTDKPKKKEN